MIMLLEVSYYFMGCTVEKVFCSLPTLIHPTKLVRPKAKIDRDKACTLLLVGALGAVALLFWPDAVRMAALVLNQTPKGILNFKRHSNFGVIVDCKALVMIPSELQTNKFGTRLVVCGHLGPDAHRAGYNFFTLILCMCLKHPSSIL